MRTYTSMYHCMACLQYSVGTSRQHETHETRGALHLFGHLVERPERGALGNCMLRNAPATTVFYKNLHYQALSRVVCDKFCAKTLCEHYKHLMYILIYEWVHYFVYASREEGPSYGHENGCKNDKTPLLPNHGRVQCIFCIFLYVWV